MCKVLKLLEGAGPEKTFRGLLTVVVPPRALCCLGFAVSRSPVDNSNDHRGRVRGALVPGAHPQHGQQDGGGRRGHRDHVQNPALGR